AAPAPPGLMAPPLATEISEPRVPPPTSVTPLGRLGTLTVPRGPTLRVVVPPPFETVPRVTVSPAAGLMTSAPLSVVAPKFTELVLLPVRVRGVTAAIVRAPTVTDGTVVLVVSSVEFAVTL